MYICIEGNIGAGKTTIAKALAKKRKSLYLPEQFDENVLLPLFYKNKTRLAFPLEYSFLLERHSQILKHFKNSGNKETIGDYSIYKCLWFAKANLSKKDNRFFKKHFTIIEKDLRRPDLIVYLETSGKNLLNNIKKRGRAYEVSISQNYLSSIGKSYSKGLKDLKKIQILKIKVSRYDARSQKEILDKIEKFIQKMEDKK
jgi:deoxyguanosine kinase